MRDEDTELKEPSGVSRREFLKISGVGLAVPLVAGPRVIEVGGAEVPAYGPGKVPMSFLINGRKQTADLEPRVTLLDGKPVYACNILAIDAQEKAITTVESLGTPDKLHPIQQAFVQNDASKCGFCTPGFIVASKALLDRYPHPTPEQISRGLAGNYCRCGTYVGIRAALTPMGAAPGRKGA